MSTEIGLIVCLGKCKLCLKYANFRMFCHSLVHFFVAPVKSFHLAFSLLTTFVAWQCACTVHTEKHLLPWPKWQPQMLTIISNRRRTNAITYKLSIKHHAFLFSVEGTHSHTHTVSLPYILICHFFSFYIFVAECWWVNVWLVCVSVYISCAAWFNLMQI